MQTVVNAPTNRKPLKMFYSHLFMDAGILAKPGGTLIFVREADQAIIDVEPQHCLFLTVLGEVGLSETQALEDLINGGPAGVACSREEGRA